MRFAFLIMGDGLDSARDRASIHQGMCSIIGVRDLEDACTAARKLLDEGIGCIEVCGAFGPEGARKVAEATEGKIPVGYITHLPEQEGLHRAVFGS